MLTPLHGPGLFAVIDRIGQGDNLEEFWFDTPYEVVEGKGLPPSPCPSKMLGTCWDKQRAGKPARSVTSDSVLRHEAGDVQHTR